MTHTLEGAHSSSAASFLNNLNTMQVPCFGYALYLSWFFFIATGALLRKADGTAPYAVLIFFLGSILTSCVVWIFSKTLIRNKKAALLVAIVAVFFSILPSLAILFQSAYQEIVNISFLFGGVGSSLFYVIWGFPMSCFNHKEAIIFPEVSVCIETIIILIITTLLKEQTLIIVYTMLPIASFVFFFIWNRKVMSEQSEPLNVKPPDWKSLLQSSSAIISTSLLFGFVLSTTAIRPSIIFVILFSMFIASVLKGIDSTHSQRFEVNGVIRVLAPTAAIVFLLAPFLSLPWKVAGIALAMLVSMICRIVTSSAICEYMHVYRLTPYSNMAFIGFVDIIGIGIGYVCGCNIFDSSFEMSREGMLVASFVVIAIILLQSFVFRDNYQPFTEHKSILDDVSNEQNSRNQEHVGHWKSKCLAFAEQYALTPRQTDTLVLVAKGYSTSYITETLCVSDHTVKAHLFAIYQKTDVHSRQELINKIESYNPSIDMTDYQ